MIDAVIHALLVVQLGSICFFVSFSRLPYLWGGASRGPGGDGIEKSNRRCHLALPVDRPEEVEARQFEGRISNIRMKVFKQRLPAD